MTRFLISYGVPSVEATGMPPRTQSGPRSPVAGSSVTTMTFSRSRSIGSPVALS